MQRVGQDMRGSLGPGTPVLPDVTPLPCSHPFLHGARPQPDVRVRSLFVRPLLQSLARFPAGPIRRKVLRPKPASVFHTTVRHLGKCSMPASEIYLFLVWYNFSRPSDQEAAFGHHMRVAHDESRGPAVRTIWMLDGAPSHEAPPALNSMIAQPRPVHRIATIVLDLNVQPTHSSDIVPGWKPLGIGLRERTPNRYDLAADRDSRRPNLAPVLRAGATTTSPTFAWGHCPISSPLISTWEIVNYFHGHTGDGHVDPPA